MIEVLDVADIGVVASAVLAGGVLAGGANAGRIAGRADDPGLAPALAAADRLADIAARIGATAGAVAIAFALADEHVTSVLFGATKPEQVAANVAALDVELDRDILEDLRALALPPIDT